MSSEGQRNLLSSISCLQKVAVQPVSFQMKQTSCGRKKGGPKLRDSYKDLQQSATEQMDHTRSILPPSLLQRQRQLIKEQRDHARSNLQPTLLCGEDVQAGSVSMKAGGGEEAISTSGIGRDLTVCEPPKVPGYSQEAAGVSEGIVG